TLFASIFSPVFYFSQFKGNRKENMGVFFCLICDSSQHCMVMSRTTTFSIEPLYPSLFIKIKQDPPLFYGGSCINYILFRCNYFLLMHKTFNNQCLKNHIQSAYCPV